MSPPNYHQQPILLQINGETDRRRIRRALAIAFIIFVACANGLLGLLERRLERATGCGKMAYFLLYTMCVLSGTLLLSPTIAAIVQCMGYWNNRGLLRLALFAAGALVFRPLIRLVQIELESDDGVSIFWVLFARLLFLFPHAVILQRAALGYGIIRVRRSGARWYRR